jgi:hypothetical protein
MRLKGPSFAQKTDLIIFHLFSLKSDRYSEIIFDREKEECDFNKNDFFNGFVRHNMKNYITILISFLYVFIYDNCSSYFISNGTKQSLRIDVDWRKKSEAVLIHQYLFLTYLKERESIQNGLLNGNITNEHINNIFISDSFGSVLDKNIMKYIVETKLKIIPSQIYTIDTVKNKLINIESEQLPE